MSYDKTMNFLIFDGDPNGIIMGELSNWNGRVYKIARSALSSFAHRPDCQHTGIYFLFGRDLDMNDTIYVGEAEQMLKRLKQHINDHEEWNDCIAVISKDDHLNKAHVKHLEHDFYQLAVQAHRYTVSNSTVPTCSSVSEYDQAMLLEFIDHTKLLVNTLGYKAFEGISISSVQPNATSSIMEYTIKSRKGADARGISVTGGFTVLKGSKVATSVAPSLPLAYQNYRNRLMATGIIDSSFTFTCDHFFSYSSPAASIVCGVSTSGPQTWRNQTGKTLAMVEAMKIEK